VARPIFWVWTNSKPGYLQGRCSASIPRCSRRPRGGSNRISGQAFQEASPYRLQAIKRVRRGKKMHRNRGCRSGLIGRPRNQPCIQNLHRSLWHLTHRLDELLLKRRCRRSTTAADSHTGKQGWPTRHRHALAPGPFAGTTRRIHPHAKGSSTTFNPRSDVPALTPPGSRPSNVS